jgi:signal peptidase II
VQAEAGTALNVSDADHGTAARAHPRRPRVSLSWLFGVLAIAVLVYTLDRVTKTWALENLTPGVRQPWLGEVLQLHLIFNPGAAFSFGTSATWVFTIIQATVAVGILAVAPRLRSKAWAVGGGLALGGALGNLTDRLTREPGFGVGHVVDFLELPHWPIFNIADSAIVAAAVLVAGATMAGVGAFGRDEPGASLRRPTAPDVPAGETGGPRA